MVIVVSNGCYLTQNECGIMIGTLADLIEKIVNDEFVELTIIRHSLNEEYISGNRDEFLIKIAGVNCISNNPALTAAYDLLKDSNDEEKKVEFVSFCQCEDGDDNSCNIADIEDPNSNIETNVLDIDSEVSESNEFLCLVNKGESYFDFHYLMNMKYWMELMI